MDDCNQMQALNGSIWNKDPLFLPARCQSTKPLCLKPLDKPDKLTAYQRASLFCTASRNVKIYKKLFNIRTWGLYFKTFYESYYCIIIG